MGLFIYLVNFINLKITHTLINYFPSLIFTNIKAEE